ncbi:MAG TPA: hypothetical protein PLV83_04555 [Bacilli bacterium]|nr:hypothetical protein [Bacilli bacterium]
MHDIDIYNNSVEILTRKEEKIYIRFIMNLLIFSLIVLCIILYKYPNEYHFEGFVNENKIMVYLKENELQQIKASKIKIKDKEMNYVVDSIIKLDRDITNIQYYLVSIKVEEELLDNDIIKFNIVDGTTNLYKSFIKRIWKGF